MLKKRTAVCVLGLTGLFASSFAHAHVGVHNTGTLFEGMLHPFTGLDHVVAMIAVGLWAAQRGGRSLWMIPAAFVALVAAGAALGILGTAVPYVSSATALSVLILGLLIAAAIRLPVMAAGLIVGLFAVYHGHLHGMEAAETGLTILYIAGLVTVTALLHCCGIGLGLWAQNATRSGYIRYAGAAIAALGMYLCMA